MKRRRTAFTLVELIMVIVIIGLLAAVVTPRFMDLRTEAVSAAEKGTVSAIVSGIKLAHMTNLAKNDTSYPATLDSAQTGDASPTNPLFTAVIDGGVTDSNWKKIGTLAYQYKPSATRYTYNRTTGQFAVPAPPPPPPPPPAAPLP